MWEQRRDEAGRGADPATSCLGCSPALAGFHTLCTGRVPHLSRPRAPRGQHRPLALMAVLSETSVSEKPADAHHPFPLLRVSFPCFWARGLSPEPLPPPPHPSRWPAHAPRI